MKPEDEDKFQIPYRKSNDDDISLQIDPIVKIENLNKLILKQNFLIEENKSKELFTIINTNILSLKNSSNISIITSTISDSPRLREVEVFTIDSEKGVVRGSISQSENQDDLFGFLDGFQRQTYFPILLDLNNPSQIIFGIGNNARFSSGSPVPESQTLIRNGGHQQLLLAYNRQRQGEGSNGIFGGGIFLNSLGQIQVEFKSRSLNSGKAGVVDGQISDEQEAVLRELVLTILRKAQDKVGANLVTS